MDTKVLLGIAGNQNVQKTRKERKLVYLRDEIRRDVGNCCRYLQQHGQAGLELKKWATEGYVRGKLKTISTSIIIF